MVKDGGKENKMHLNYIKNMHSSDDKTMSKLSTSIESKKDGHAITTKITEFTDRYQAHLVGPY